MQQGIKLFAGNASRALAERIANVLGLELGDCEVGRFSDGEISVNIRETVRGMDVFLVPVSYTHLDVYKRQASPCPPGSAAPIPTRRWRRGTWAGSIFTLWTACWLRAGPTCSFRRRRR